MSEAVEKIDVRALLAHYKGGGTSSYHPKMRLKVLVYAYAERIYSSRRIAKALRENIANPPLVMAGATLVILPTVIIFLLAQCYFIEGVATTGMKN